MTKDKKELAQKDGYNQLIDQFSKEAVDALIELQGIDYAIAYMDETYCGKFDNDEDFAHNMAQETGAISSALDTKNDSWPLTCIDWEEAASELMMDYDEKDNHYFRSI